MFVFVFVFVLVAAADATAGSTIVGIGIASIRFVVRVQGVEPACNAQLFLRWLATDPIVIDGYENQSSCWKYVQAGAQSDHTKGAHQCAHQQGVDLKI